MNVTTLDPIAEGRRVQAHLAAIANGETRLNRAAIVLSEARTKATEATQALISASEEYQRAAQHLTAELSA